MTKRATSPASITRSMFGRRTRAARSPIPRSSDAIGPLDGKPASHRGGLLLRLHKAPSAASTNALKRREGFDQPAIQLRKHAGQKGDAGEHEKASHEALDMREMGAKAREEGGKRLHRERGDDEGDAESERIDGQQARALGDRRLRCRDGENCRKNRPDARRPAERER